MIIEQNENTCFISKLLALFLIFSLCIPLFSFSASASDSSSVSWDNQPVYSGPAVTSLSELFSVGTPIVRTVNPSPPAYIYAAVDSSRSSSDVYFAFTDYSDKSGTRAVKCWYASASPFFICLASSSYSSFRYDSCAFDSNVGLYIMGLTYHIANSTYPDGTLSDSLCGPYFESRDDCFAALADVCENGIPSTADPHDLSFSLPAGNVMFLELSSSTSSIDLFQEMGVLSSLFSTNGNWWMPYDSYGFSNSLPSSSDRLSGSSISWGKSGNTNFLGQTTSASYSLSFSNPSSQYLWIQHLSASQDQYDEFSNPILIRASGILSYKVYPLDSGIISVDGELSTGTIVGSGDSFTGTYDPDTQSWVTTNDTTGQAGAPSVGGDNIGSSALGSGGKTIFNFLQKIADDLSTFFRGAVGAVSTLVSSASDFFTSIGGLFSWLPSPVYSVLISALILAITIGVIKVFI